MLVNATHLKCLAVSVWLINLFCLRFHFICMGLILYDVTDVMLFNVVYLT